MQQQIQERVDQFCGSEDFKSKIEKVRTLLTNTEKLAHNTCLKKSSLPKGLANYDDIIANALEKGETPSLQKQMTARNK